MTVPIDWLVHFEKSKGGSDQRYRGHQRTTLIASARTSPLQPRSQDRPFADSVDDDLPRSLAAPPSDIYPRRSYAKNESFNLEAIDACGCRTSAGPEDHPLLRPSGQRVTESIGPRVCRRSVRKR